MQEEGPQKKKIINNKYIYNLIKKKKRGTGLGVGFGWVGRLLNKSNRQEDGMIRCQSTRFRQEEECICGEDREETDGAQERNDIAGTTRRERDMGMG